MLNKVKKNGIAYPLAIAGVLGLIAFGTTVQVITAATNMEDIWVAGRDIPAHTKISEMDLIQIQKPKKGISSDAYIDKKDIVGKYALQDIYKGEEIIKQKVIKEGGDTRSIIAAKLKEGMVAMTVPVKDSSRISRYLKPGDRINIDVTITTDNISATKRLLDGVEVLDVTKKDDVINNFMIAIPAEMEQKIALALTKGDYVVSIVPLEYENNNTEKGVSMDELLNEFSVSTQINPVTKENINQVQPK